MKNFKCQLNIVSRSSGASVIQRAAYRAGEKLLDEETGKTHDYSYRRDVSYNLIHAPSGSPEWAFDSEKAWNAAGRLDKRKNSRLARELMISLPARFPELERIVLIKQIAQWLVHEYQVLVHAVQHEPKIFSKEELAQLKNQHAVEIPGYPGFFHNENWHAHILFSTREMTPFGFGKKTRVLDDKVTGRKEIEKIRHAVADMINTRARAMGIDLFMYAKSARRRGVMEIPTVPLGQKGHWAAKRGFANELAELNERIKAYNAGLIDLPPGNEHVEPVPASVLEPLPAPKRRPMSGPGM